MLTLARRFSHPAAAALARSERPPTRAETGVFVLLTIAENEPDQILREAAPAAGLSGEVIFEKRAWNEKYSILCLRRARA